MTCATMLDRMLEADLEELAAVGTTPLAAHIRECARCRAIADRLSRETHMLALALPNAESSRVDARSGRPTGRARRLVLAIGIAATLALMVGRTRHREVRTSRDDRSVDRPTAPPSMSGATRPMDGPPRRGSARSTALTGADRLSRSDRIARAAALTVQSVVTRPVELVAATRAVPVAPVRFDVAASGGALGNRVAVDPPTGVQASIIRTATPGVTVVWLYH